MNKKNISRFIITLVLICALFTLSSCSLLFSEINNLTTIREKEKDSGVEYNYNDHFTDSYTGKVKYVTLDKQEVYLLKGDTASFKLAVYEEGKTPQFNSSFSNLKWLTGDESVATVDQDGFLTAVGEGETKVYGQLFTNVAASADVYVVKKELTSIKLENIRKTYSVGSVFTPNFDCIAVYSERAEEKVVDNIVVDYSRVNMAVEGFYEVSVSYTFDGVTKSTSYTINVITNPSYTPIHFDSIQETIDKNSYFGLCPLSGNVKCLILPVWFNDSSTWITGGETQKEKIRTDLNTAFFSEGTEDGWNSVNSFYKKASSNTLSFYGTVAEWCYIDYSYEDVVVKAAEGKISVTEIVSIAVENYFTNHPDESLADYDLDNDGIADQIDIIYAVPDKDEELGQYNNVFWGKVDGNGSVHVSGSTLVRQYMWASYDSMYSDTLVDHVDTHTFIHETGHTLGLDDYYDYGDNDYRAIAGGVTMFHNTHEQDPYSMLLLGWAEAIVPEMSCTIELEDFQSSHTVILLSAKPYSVNSQYEEYILVELYAPNGLNEFDTHNAWRGYYSKGALNPGIRLWHVDSRLIVKNGDEYEFTDDVNATGVDIAMTNSYDAEGRSTVLGEEYDDYALLFEIRNDKELSYKPKTSDNNCMFSDATLFHAGDTFNMESYSSQFKNGELLNNGEEFGWIIEIESISSNSTGGYSAVINLTYSL